MYEIVVKSTAELIPYTNNARTHSDEQVEQLARFIDEYGFTNPVLIDNDNGIIAGHGRLLAAERLELKEVPTLCLGWLTEEQKRAYVIADNQVALNADWDLTMLQAEVQALVDAAFDTDLLGFSDSELDNILGSEEGIMGDDDVPEVPEIPVSVLGDVWILGDHKLLCGDSTDRESYNALLGLERADLIFTDPPYGMSYGGGRAAGSSAVGARVKAHGPILGDNLEGDSLIALVKDAISEARTVTKPGAGAYVCFTWRTYAQFEEALQDFGIKCCIVWDKQSIGLGHSHYRPQHEFIFYCNGPWYGGRDESDVWKMSRGSTGEYVHPTQKPVELIERALTNSSKRGDIVLDSFGGSGSTLIACEKTGRNARLIELDPKYVDVIVKRWERYTGLSAVTAAGQSFAEVHQ